MFEVQVLRETLLAALNAVESTVGDNSQNLGCDCVSITDLGNNTLEIYTTNSIEFSKVNIIVIMGSSKTVEQMPYVNFKRFKNIINSVDENEYISIKSIVNDIEITYGTRKKPIKLTGSTNSMISIVNNFNNVTSSITLPKHVLKDALAGTCSIIKDGKSPSINDCMDIDYDKNDITITSIDVTSNRIYCYKTEAVDIQNGHVTVEANKLKKAFKLFEPYNLVKIETNGNLIKISGDDPINKKDSLFESAEYYLRQIAGSFPQNLTSYMEPDKAQSAIIDNKSFIASLERVKAIEDTTTNPGCVNINIFNDVINITKSTQYGILEDSFGVTNTFNVPINVTFNVSNLFDIVKNFDNGNFYLANPSKMSATSGYLLYSEKDLKSVYFVSEVAKQQQSNP